MIVITQISNKIASTVCIWRKLGLTVACQNRLRNENDAFTMTEVGAKPQQIKGIGVMICIVIIITIIIENLLHV